MFAGPGTASRRYLRLRPRLGSADLVLPGFVLALFVASRLVFAWCGVRTDTSLLFTNGIQQLLSLDQLQHHLTSSIWYLQSQPPLFNLATGLVLKLPHFAWHPAIAAISLLMGAGLSLSTLYLCLELGLARSVSLVVAVLVTIDPANILYQSFYFYTYPTAVLMTFGSLAFARYVRTQKLAWGSAAFSSAAGLVLLNSTFQWPWLAGVVVVLLVAVRKSWRQALVVGALPILVVGFWYTKNGILFGTTTSSSWLGMNMARITTMTGPIDGESRLVHQGRLSPLALYPPFEPLSTYPTKYQRHPHSSVEVLDAPTKSGGAPNFNDMAYIRLSSDWLSVDLHYIQLFPKAYLYNVGKATQIYLLPPDEYELVAHNESAIAGYAHVFHLLVDWQPDQPRSNAGRLNLNVRTFAAPSQMSVSNLLALVLTVFGLPLVAWRTRQSRSLAATLLFIWFSTVYVTVVTCLTEIGENQRFRFDLGPLPLIGAAVLASWLVASRSVRFGAPEWMRPAGGRWLPRRDGSEPLKTGAH